jgi:hypothetical protein
LRLLKSLIFFGKRDLAFGINLPERIEIWKTFWRPLMALTVDTLLAAVRGCPCTFGHVQRVDIIVRFALPNRTFLGVAFDPQPTLDD